MFRIRRFGVVKTATVAALMYFVVVLIFVIPIALIVAVAGTQSTAGRDGTPLFDPALGAAGVFVFGLLAAVLYGLIGWIFTAVACLIYNLVARWTGGIEVQVERREPPVATVPATWGAPSGPPPAAPPAS